MITVIAATNRPNSKTKQVAEHIYQNLQANNVDVKFVSLCQVKWSEVIDTMYDPSKHSAELRSIDEDLMIGADKWIVVCPEYNGSMPGVFKLFIDAISTHRYADTFSGKKALLVGVASGRAGNLRGMEHITGFLNYLKVHVYPEKLPISSITQVMDENGKLNDETAETVNALIHRFTTEY